MTAADSTSPAQFQLFEPPEDAPVAHPGQQSVEAWHNRADIVYHGTFKDAPAAVPGMHFGTNMSAGHRVDQHRAGDRASLESVTGTPQGDVGRVYSYRLNAPVGINAESRGDLGTRFQDLSEANNATDFFTGHKFALPTRESLESNSSGAGRALESLEAGNILPYRNIAEDEGSTSYTIPGPDAVKTWSQDVMEAHEQGHDVHPHDLAYARQLEGRPTSSWIQHSGRRTGSALDSGPGGRTRTLFAGHSSTGNPLPGFGTVVTNPEGGQTFGESIGTSGWSKGEAMGATSSEQYSWPRDYKGTNIPYDYHLQSSLRSQGWKFDQVRTTLDPTEDTRGPVGPVASVRWADVDQASHEERNQQLAERRKNLGKDE